MNFLEKSFVREGFCLSFLKNLVVLPEKILRKSLLGGLILTLNFMPKEFSEWLNTLNVLG